MLTTKIKLANPLMRSTFSLLALFSFFIEWFGGISKLALAIFIFLSSQLALAQQIDLSDEGEVTALLAEIEAQGQTRSIFSIHSGRKIAEVEFDSEFKIIQRIGKWSIVEFNQQTVPGWVSSDYVVRRGARISVDVTRLNMRLSPSLNSPVMLQLERGFNSELNGQKNGFVKVLAPKNYRVAIFSGSDEQASKDYSLTQAHSSANDVINAIHREPRVEPEPSSSVISGNDGRPKPVSNSQQGEEAATSSERLHVIAPGDAVSLLVFGETDLSIENVRVPQSGRVSFPLIGSVLVAGRTIPQVEESVAELLAQGYVKNPRLSVTIFSYRPVFIRGAVQQTGSFPFSEGLTVGKLIALAGGSKKSAKRNGVSILREGNVIEGSLAIDSLVEVKSGDVISIEEEIGVQEDDAIYIYLHGEVASPGEYQFRRGLTVEKAIVLAGGFTLRGSRKKISVTRYVGIDVDQEPEKLRRVKLYTPIQPGDIINVGATWF